MQKLPIQFEGTGEVRGIKFTLNRRNGNICIYERSDGYFEVITVRQQKESIRMIAGREVHFEEKEIYPSGESWNGKCVKTLDTAIYWFNKLSLTQN
jgi:hypothetical protein